MRRLYFSLSTLVAAALVAGCSGNVGTPIVGRSNSSSIPALQRALHLHHTPLPVKRIRHRVTAADSALRLPTRTTNRLPRVMPV